MGKLIRNLLNSQLVLDYAADRLTQSDRVLSSEIICKREKLDNMLNSEDRELLDELVADIRLEDSHEIEFRQEQGFCLGILVMSEVMTAAEKNFDTSEYV